MTPEENDIFPENNAIILHGILYIFHCYKENAQIIKQENIESFCAFKLIICSSYALHALEMLSP